MKGKNKCLRCGAKWHSEWANELVMDGLCTRCFREWEKVKPLFLKAWINGAMPLEVFND